MMKLLKYLLLAFAMLLNMAGAAAQNAFSGTIQNLNAKVLYLNAYTGLRMQPVDSVQLASDGRFVFSGSLKKGMYELQTKGGFRLELLYAGRPVQLVMQNANDLKTIQFINSPENEKWLTYTLSRDSYRYLVEIVKSVLRQYDPSKAYYQQTQVEYSNLGKEFYRVSDSLIALGDDYAARLIKTDRDPIVDLKMSAEEQRKWLTENYFKDLDFNDLDLIPTNVLTTKMIDYLSVFQDNNVSKNTPEMDFIVGLSKIFALAKTNMQMYEFVMEYMLEGFTSLGMSGVTDFLLSYPQLYEGDIRVEEALRLDSITVPFQKVRVGVPAPSISGLAIDGHSYNLYAASAKYTIILFWSTDCEYCHDYLTRLKRLMEKNADIDLVTVAIADDEKEVNKHLAKLKMPGHHFYDPQRWESPIYKDYHVFSTPTIFVIDENQTIVCKPFDWDELMNCIK